MPQFTTAFDACSQLATVRVEATEVPTLESVAFSNSAEGLVIEVPSASLSLYEADSAWSKYELKGYTE